MRTKFYYFEIFQFIYPRFNERLGIKEGEEITIKLEGNKSVVETIKDPMELALKGKKFAKIKEEDVEKISLKEQERYVFLDV